MSSADETAKDVYRTLLAEAMVRDESLGVPEHEFLTTGAPEEFKELAHRFLGPEVSGVAKFQ